jgi:hypothetical protein
VEQLLAGQEDSQGNINYEEFVRTVMNGWSTSWSDSTIEILVLPRRHMLKKGNFSAGLQPTHFVL